MVLTKGADSDVVVTLNEKRTLSSGYHLFVFTHIVQRTVVNKIFNFLEDLSDYPDRYNKFTLPAALFSSSAEGRWRYEVYEQASSTNTDITGLTEVERGLMELNPSSEFSFTEYAGTTTFKEYAG